MYKTRWGTAEIKCPFFRKHEPLVISCEGITDDSAIRIVFRQGKKREQHEEIFCTGKYQNCEIYRAVMGAKYDD